MRQHGGVVLGAGNDDNGDNDDSDDAGRLTPLGMTLHAVRLLGMPSHRDVISLYWLYGLDHAEVGDLLLDAQAFGWVTRHDVTLPLVGRRVLWSLTDRGREQNERWLAADVEARGARPALLAAHERFRPWNEQLLDACTRWQLRPTALDPLAENDHHDVAYDAAIVDELDDLGRRLRRLTDSVTQVLPRFGVHAERFDAALEGVHDGSLGWVDAPEWTSCHVVGMQLHEDLLASLGVSREAEAP